MTLQDGMAIIIDIFGKKNSYFILIDKNFRLISKQYAT